MSGRNTSSVMAVSRYSFTSNRRRAPRVATNPLGGLVAREAQGSARAIVHIVVHDEQRLVAVADVLAIAAR